jgi:hypothetical protein
MVLALAINTQMLRILSYKIESISYQFFFVYNAKHHLQQHQNVFCVINISLHVYIGSSTNMHSKYSFA